MDLPRPPEAVADAEACYRALCSRDARFDGRFFTGVTSTGIYCRPVCAVRTPRRDNCRFFASAAQAERAGFRPCLRCRPELAPRDRHWSTQDAGDILLRQAIQWLDHPGDPTEPRSLPALAARLGVSDRHLRRLFESRLGVSPLQYLQTRRLLAAKQLLTDTALPVTTVALASGFASLRRFNAAIQTHYHLNPSQLRRTAHVSMEQRAIPLAWRPPLDAPALLGFFASRQIPGLEAVDLPALTLRRTIRLQRSQHTRTHTHTHIHTGWIEARFQPDAHRLLLRVSESLQAELPAVLGQVRQLFDLDADPAAIQSVLGADFPDSAGLRVPGCVDGFELAVRAVLGQQITVAAARTLASRLVQRLGAPIDTGLPGLDRLFPDAATLAETPASVLGELGIVRQRQAAIQALAHSVAQGTLSLQPDAPLEPTLTALQALPGIGPWTAHYIALRALRWPDAWPPGDSAVHQALQLTGSPRAREAQATRLAEAWQPWRGYAVLRLWAGLYRKDPS